MQTPEVMFTAELTHCNKPVEDKGIKVGMPGYTDITIYAELGSGHRVSIANLYAAKVEVAPIPNLNTIAVYDEDGHWRGNCYVQNYKWMN